MVIYGSPRSKHYPQLVCNVGLTGWSLLSRLQPTFNVMNRLRSQCFICIHDALIRYQNHETHTAPTHDFMLTECCMDIFAGHTYTRYPNAWHIPSIKTNIPDHRSLPHNRRKWFAPAKTRQTSQHPLYHSILSFSFLQIHFP